MSDAQRKLRKRVEDAVAPPVEALRLVTDQVVMESEEFGPRAFTSVFEHSADAMARVARLFLGIGGPGHYREFMQTPAYQKMIDAAIAYHDFEIAFMRAERHIV